jgi:hypothetical protein
MAGLAGAIAAMAAANMASRASTRRRGRICIGRPFSGEVTQVRSRGRAQRRTASAIGAR